MFTVISRKSGWRVSVKRCGSTIDYQPQIVIDATPQRRKLLHVNKKRVVILAVFLAGLFMFFVMAFLSEAKGLGAGQVVSNALPLLWNTFADVLGFFTSDLGILILIVLGIALAVAKTTPKQASGN